jgi:hypothetical protein
MDIPVAFRLSRKARHNASDTRQVDCNLKSPGKTGYTGIGRTQEQCSPDPPIELYNSIG